ncbi:MAG: prolyl oligopeptidase family serine peptidase [Actinocatenispora sp.]
MRPDLLRQVSRTRLYRLGVPRDVTIAPDGSEVLFLRSEGDDPATSLWRFDVATGTETLVADGAALAGGQLSAAERTRRERSREMAAGIVGYSTDAARTRAVFTLDGLLWTVALDGAEPRRLPATGSVVEPRLDPAGTRVAYVSDGALRLVDVEAGLAGDEAADRAVATGENADVTYGLPEHVAAESMHRRQGYWWAPDSSRLLVARVDNGPVGRWYIADPADPASPPAEIAYPAAGTANADVTLWLYDPAGGAPTEVVWDRAGFEYLAAVTWSGRCPYLLVQSRDQRDVRVLSVEPDTGATTLVHADHDDAWWELVPGLPAVTGDGALVWTRDDGDTRRLLVAGEPVTPPGLQVGQVVGVDDDEVLFVGCTEPTERYVWRWRRDTGAVRLGDEPGVYSGSSTGGCTVLLARTLDRHGVRVTVHRDGVPTREIASHALVPPIVPLVTLHRFGDRDLRSAVLLPTGYERGSGPLPVLLDPYAGPGAQTVLSARNMYLISQWFADQGYAVLVTDGRGTPGRGPVWEHAVRGDALGLALTDQIDALRAAAVEYPELDLSRVGIRGWSYGGYLAAAAVLRYPDVFHVAVAGAPVTDPLLYDTHWQERYLGHPEREPENYRRSSLLPDAPRLTRPLLLVHGLADDNVHAAHTLQLSAALLAAGREHSVLPLPGGTHMAVLGDVMANLTRRELAFLDRVLRP